MESNQFTIKKKCSCNGCYFYRLHNRVDCLQVENMNLLAQLFRLFGECSKKEIIYILKDE
jgi:hypothetical protein